MPLPPAGTTPASAYVPEPHALPEQVPVILADKIDPETGEFLSLVEGRDPTDAAVQVTFTTERRSGASAMNHGHRFRDLRHQDELTEASVTAIAEQAARHLIDAGDVRIEGVRVPKRDPGLDEHGQAEVRFRNLRTGEEIPQRIG